MADSRRQGEARAKARRVSSRLRAMIEVYSLSRFWTFTFFMDIPEHLRMEHWHRFMMALRKYHPKLQYFTIKEPHPKSGRLHLHVLFDRYVDWYLVQRLWEQAKCGKVVHVAKIDKCGIERYITKYMTKAIESRQKGLIGTAYSSSRCFCLHLGSFPKWCLKLFSLGRTELLDFILDKFDFSMYYRCAGRAKRMLMYQVHDIALSIEEV